MRLLAMCVLVLSACGDGEGKRYETIGDFCSEWAESICFRAYTCGAAGWDGWPNTQELCETEVVSSCCSDDGVCRNETRDDIDELAAECIADTEAQSCPAFADGAIPTSCIS